MRISQTTGYQAVGDGHHIIPFTTWDEIGFDLDAMQFLDDAGDVHKARIATAGHNYTAHPRYTHEIRAEWEKFLESTAGKKFKGSKTFGKDAAEAFLKHVKLTDNPYIKGFNAVVKDGPSAVKAWSAKEGVKIAFSVLNTPFFKNAARRLGKTLPYVKYVIGAITYADALEKARAAHDTEAAAQLEALAEVFNPLPFSQQDIRDAEESGKLYFKQRQMEIQLNRFGEYLY